MQIFEQYDPRNPKPEHQLLRFFESPMKTDGMDFYFIKQNSHFLVYRERVHTFPETSSRAGQSKLIANQIELPIPAIRWFIDVIEQKFFKPPEEGGLPAHKLSYEEEVAGETLHILRSMGAGCDHPGYTITNASRQSHMSSDDLQTLSLSDPWLFENGLMDYLKQLAEDYEQGRL
ncbi:hypothetical protein [Marinimicrobium locisalis]|uniref:hypothetical protein n=1 Tax=Marinimicrobium locisalis TaxID=546022 RepID=UPI003221F2DA